MADKKLHNLHDWAGWSARFLEATQYWKLAPSLWVFGYERLHSAQSTSPPSWVRNWTEARMTANNRDLTEEELNVWNIVKVQFAENHSHFDVIDKQDNITLEAGENAYASIEAKRSDHNLHNSEPGTFVITCQTTGKAGDTGQESPRYD